MTLLSMPDEPRPRNGKPKADGGPLFSVAHADDARRFKALFDARVKMKGLHSEVVTITPAIAEYILANLNTHNRPLSPKKIDSYTQAMKRGEFRTTSQGISFGSDGLLKNGQHRLHGVVRSGIPIAFYVTFGEDPASFAVLDSAHGRGAADAAHISGKKNANAVCAAARLMAVIEGGSTTFSLTNQQVLDVIDAHDGLEGSSTLGLKLVKKFRCSTSAAICAIYLIAVKSKFSDRREDFVNALVSGAGLTKNAPLLKLREGLYQNTFGAQYRNNASRNYVLAGTLINTWNKWVRGRVGSISFDPKSGFPEVE